MFHVFNCFFTFLLRYPVISHYHVHLFILMVVLTSAVYCCHTHLLLNGVQRRCYHVMPWFLVLCWWNQLGPFLLFTANNIGMLLSGGVWFMGRIFFVLGIQEGEKIIPRLLWSNNIIVGIFFTLVNNNLAFSQYLIPMEEVENIYSHGTRVSHGE